VVLLESHLVTPFADRSSGVDRLSAPANGASRVPLIPIREERVARSVMTSSETKLENQIVRAVEAARVGGHYMRATDVLTSIGWLSRPLVEDGWRGPIPCPERIKGADFHHRH
jgi:hypothetical protein